MCLHGGGGGTNYEVMGWCGQILNTCGDQWLLGPQDTSQWIESMLLQAVVAYRPFCYSA